MRILRYCFWIVTILLIVVVAGLVALIAVKAACLLLISGPSGVWRRIVAMPVSAFSTLAVLSGALVALLVWIWNIRRQNSEDLLKESKSFFEKSFETLNVLDDQGRPQNDRMRWLWSARLLKVAEQIGNDIELKSHRSLYEEIRNYWRSKFRDLVEPQDDGFPEEYYAEQPGHLLIYDPYHDRRPLDLASVAVIYRFVQWPKERFDLLDNEPPFSREEIDRMYNFGPCGLGKLLRKVEEIQHQKSDREA
jgi:hypothetical protein